MRGPATPAKKTAGAAPPKKRSNLPLLAAAGAGAVLIACGVWFIFRDDKGNETARVQLSEGGTVQLLAPGESPGAGRSTPTTESAAGTVPPGDSPGAKTPTTDATNVDPSKMFALPQSTGTPPPPTVVASTPQPTPAAPVVTPLAPTAPTAPASPGGNLYLLPAVVQRSQIIGKVDSLHYDGSTPLTIEAWCMPMVTPEVEAVLATKNANGVKRIDTRLFGFAPTADGTTRLTIDWQSSGDGPAEDRWVSSYKILVDGQLKAIATQIAPAARNVPTHGAIVLGPKLADGKQKVDVYLNGKLVRTETALFDHDGSLPFFTQGFVDEVRVSKVARYSTDFTPQPRFEPDPDTLALYHCDEGSGTQLVDASGNGHHGIVTGGKWSPVGSPPGTPVATVAAPIPPIVASAPGPATVPTSGDLWVYTEPEGQFDPAIVVESLRYDGSTPLTIEGWFVPQYLPHWKRFEAPSINPSVKHVFFGTVAKQSMAKSAKTSLVLRVGFSEMPESGGSWTAFVSSWDEKSARGSSNAVSIKSPGGPIRHIAMVIGPLENGERVVQYWLDGKLQPREKRAPYTFDPNAVFTSQGFFSELRFSKVVRYTNDFTPQRRFEPDADTIALYHCDEGSGTQLIDSSGNNHHGKLTNAKWAPVGSTPGTPVIAAATNPVPSNTSPTNPTGSGPAVAVAQATIDEREIGLAILSREGKFYYLNAVGKRIKVVSTVGLPPRAFQIVAVEIVRDAPFSDSDISLLKDLTSLEDITIRSMQVTDRGLAALQDRTSLVNIDLNGTNISDSGLVYLERLSSLKSLDVTATYVTTAGAVKLKAKLPNCDVKVSTKPGSPPVVASVATPVGAPTPPVAPFVPVAVAPSPATNRHPVPATKDQQAAMALIKEVYKDDYLAARMPDKKSAFAMKLLQQAAQAVDPVERYVLLGEARAQGVDGDDPQVLRQVLQAQIDGFEIDAPTTIVDGWKAMLAKSRPATFVRVIYDDAAKRFDEAVLAADFDAAKKYADFATTTAPRLADAAVSKAARDRQTALVARQQEYAAAKAAVEKLTTLPDDAEANTVVGRYRALVEGDWPNALPLLAKGNEEPWKELATKSLAAGADGPSRAAVGDAWWDAAQAKATQKSELTAGALYWYQAALPSLTGLQKTRIEKRIADAATAVPQRKIPATPLAGEVATLRAGDTALKGEVPKVFDFGGPKPSAPVPSATVPSAPVLPSTSTPMSPIIATTQRALAERILATGAFVTVIEPNSREQRLKSTNEMPSGEFDISAIDIGPKNNSDRIDDASLQAFAGLTKLHTLNIRGSKITGAGLAYLKDLPSLTSLMISECPLNDTAIDSIAGMSKLTGLSLAMTSVSDMGVSKLQNMTQLKDVHLDGTRITDASSRIFQQWKELNRLTLDNTSFGDTGIEAISSLPRFGVLALRNTPITDRSVPVLSKMKSLGTLYLVGTKLSPPAVEALKKELPNAVRF